jgi:hypothetical protein
VCGASRPFKKLSAEAFREAIFASFVSGVIDLSVFPPLWTSRLPARPKVTSLARVQAREGVAVTSLNHEAIRVNELAAVILPLLDGTKDVDALVREILPLTVEGTERAELETMIRQELAVLCEERFLLRE